MNTKPGDLQLVRNLFDGCCQWQAESSFNTYCRYQQFELWISVMDIICWYRQLVLLRLIISVIDSWNCRSLLISTIEIVDITNTNCRSTIGIIAFMYYWYRPLEFSISYQLCTFIVDINNSNCRYHYMINERNNTNCRYRQLVLEISTMWIVDISNGHGYVSISIRIADRQLIVDIDNSNYRYRQWRFRLPYSCLYSWSPNETLVTLIIVI